MALAAVVCIGAMTAARAQVSPGPLAGPHKDLEGSLNCRECHGAADEEMDGKCLACHKEIAWLQERHRGLHGQPGLSACASCHPDHAGVEFDMVEWGHGGHKSFDHRRAGWPLSGKHATLECRRCHEEKYQVSPAARLWPRGSRGGRRWTGLEPECRSCHEDVHGGALGQDCAKCHDDSRWKPAPGFDHAKTIYPLTGKHAPVPCAGCHAAPRLNRPLDAKGRPIPLYKPLPCKECSDCHKDPHEGRLGPACASCHVVEDFRRVPQQAFNHDRTRYPLRGAHVKVTCAQCHDPKSAWGAKPLFAACGDCHKDPHAGQGTISGKKVDCAACHAVERWIPSTFTVAQHTATPYPLEGRHKQVACAACHVKNPPGVEPASLGRAGTHIRPKHARCTDCHADAHGGQLASRKGMGSCEPCHGVDGWKPSLYAAAEHKALRLPLEGRHAGLKCEACHGPKRPGLPPLPGERELGKVLVALTLREIECGECHRDPHGGAFAAGPTRAEGRPCTACHDERAFNPALLDVEAHNRFTFRLEGAHRATPCTACHAELAEPVATGPPGAGSTLLLATQPMRKLEFKQSRTASAECHKTPHGEQFAKRARGGECQSCHGLEAFRPATRFNHDRDSAFALKGAHARVACDKCHPSHQGEDGKPQIIYNPIPRRCEECHRGKTSEPGAIE